MQRRFCVVVGSLLQITLLKFITECTGERLLIVYKIDMLLFVLRKINCWITCCLKAIHWEAISDSSSAPQTRTTMWRHTHVQWGTKAVGGTKTVIAPTWTVFTSEASTMTAWCGGTGNATGTLWDSRRWRSNRSNCESLKIDTYCQRCKSPAGTLVSGNIRFVRIFGQVL